MLRKAIRTHGLKIKTMWTRKTSRCTVPSSTVVGGPENVSVLSTSVRARRVTPVGSRPRTMVVPVARPNPKNRWQGQTDGRYGCAETQIDRSLQLIVERRPERRDRFRCKDDESNKHAAQCRRSLEHSDATIDQLGELLGQKHDRQHGNDEEERVDYSGGAS
jgi:hypothetical protein